MNNSEILKRLTTASYTCHYCGTKWGLPRAGVSTWHRGKCDVCNRITSVTKARDYSYFITGIRQLRGEMPRRTRGLP